MDIYVYNIILGFKKIIHHMIFLPTRKKHIACIRDIVQVIKSYHNNFNN